MKAAVMKAVELLKGMLALDPKKRITATDAVLMGAATMMFASLLCSI
jgi:hypothetical protein